MMKTVTASAFNSKVVSSVTDAHTADSFEKGGLFEKYIIDLFNERYFKLVNWRKSRKDLNTLPFLNYSNPDLELVFTGRGKSKFAIECKWRKQFVSGKIFWAKESQISTYKRFEKENGMPVFVAIGVGGLPSKPEKLFVTPLQNISTHCQVYESALIPFKRKPTHRFFYDTVQLKLF